MQTAKRKRAAKTAIIALVLGALVLIVVVKQFPQKATALLPEGFSVSSCRVTRMSSDKAEDSPLTKAQQGELLEHLEETQMVRRGSSPTRSAHTTTMYIRSPLKVPRQSLRNRSFMNAKSTTAANYIPSMEAGPSLEIFLICIHF